VAIGDFMGTISREKKIQDYSNIAHEISVTPAVKGKVIAQKVDLSTNTVYKYLKVMYECHIMVGPWISLKPHPTYREYVYLMNFSDSFSVFEQLKGFPHVLYQGTACGDWNTMVITDRLLDLSQLVGFESVVYLGKKGVVYTPPVDYCSWSNWLKKMYDRLDTFSFNGESENTESAPILDWGEDEWKLYHAFKPNVRKKATRVLKKLHVRYETYTQWLDTLHDHCTIHTEFYPEGMDAYAQYFFCLILITNNQLSHYSHCFP
jgi:hypothetical protein